MRLDKFLSQAGVVSRRHAKQYVWDGRVQVNGTIAESPGVAVDPQTDTVRVDGEGVTLAARNVYLAVHKPPGVLSTASDDRGRPTVLDLVPPDFGRVYPIGRLDFDSEGLLLLTNDGALTHRVLHPSYHVDKTYHVWIQPHISRQALEQLRQGVEIEGGLTAPAGVSVIKTVRQAMILEFVLHEGRKRQIRRMCRAVKHQVTRLVRVQFGPIPLGDLPRGKWRQLTPPEIQALYHSAGLPFKSS